MKLLSSPASPFVAKVRLAAAYHQFDLPIEHVNTGDVQPELVAANPLGKIPTLILDDGRNIYDSRVIMAYIDDMLDGKIYPDFEAKRKEAFWDGIGDAAVAIVYENRFRPEAIRHQPWIDRQDAKIQRALAHVHDQVKSLPAPNAADQKDLHAGHFAMLAILSWFDLRFEGAWRKDYPALLPIFEQVKNNMPNTADILPN